MAWRVTEDEVRAIVETEEDLSLYPFIESANAITDYVSSKDSNSVLTTALLKEIEKCLAAHFYSRRDLPYQQKKTGEASATFQGKTGMGFDSTFWGQDAKRLDVSGCLARLDKEPRPTASAVWLGLPPSDQTDYEDRD